MIKGYEKNFFGAKLNSCSTNPMTGFKRNGCCESVEGDYGKHIICAGRQRILKFSLSKGNDLITPNNNLNFRVLKLVIDGVYAQEDGVGYKSHAPRKSFLHRQVWKLLNTLMLRF